MSMDQFMQELFTEAPTDFASRYGAVNDPTSSPLGFAPQQQPAAANVPFPPTSPNVPMPQPRPDIESILAGRNTNAAPPPAVPGIPPAAPGVPMMPPALDVPSGADAYAALRGPQRGNMQTPLPASQIPGIPPATPPTGPNGRLASILGLDAPAEKRMRSALAAGLSDGNPNFKAGALFKGVSGGLKGGLASDKADTDAAITAGDKKQAQSNFDRAQTDKEETGKALRGLYGARATATLDNSASRTKLAVEGKPNNAWNKPPAERWKDANKLILDYRKSLTGSVSPLASSTERAQQKADVEKQVGEFQRKTYQQYGIKENPDGTVTDASPPTNAAGAPSRAPAKKNAGTYDDPHQPLSQDEFDGLPAGAYFINPKDGEIMRKKANE